MKWLAGVRAWSSPWSVAPDDILIRPHGNALRAIDRRAPVSFDPGGTGAVAMSDSPTMSSGASLGARLARDPAALILLAANLVPLLGVLFWGWDAFVLLMLYWLETAIIGFWMLVRLSTASAAEFDLAKADGTSMVAPRIAVTLFFIVHAGIFMGVHFVFLWALFSGDWAARVHGPGDFVRQLVIGTDLWLPLLVLFIARGAVFLYDRLGAGLFARLRGRPVRAAAPETAGGIVGAFYARIVVMHVAIIFGGFLSFLGSVGPLIIMVVLKTAIDVGLHIVFNARDGAKAFNALIRPRSGAARQSPPAS